MKKRVNWIESQEESWYKLLQKGQMTDLDQIYVQLSLDLNVIETNWFFSVESWGQYDWVAHKIETQ